MNCVITVTDKNYFQHTKYLCGHLRLRGQWRGDIIILSNGLDGEQQKELKQAGMIVIEIEQVSFNWAKVSIFDKGIIGKYERILYLDQDVIFQESIEGIFEQSGDFLSHSDTQTIEEEMDTPLKWSNRGQFKKLWKNYDPNEEAFCAGVMLFDSKIIDEMTIERLISLRESVKSINHLMGVKDGMVDQPVLNLYFYKEWKKLEGVDFSRYRNRYEKMIMMHTTRKRAPWLVDKIGYRQGLKYFESMKAGK
jgi:lipopolysaccharide biosynthesis glycosyltransferase